MICERPPTLEQLERLEKENANQSTEQDLINAYLLKKIADLEAKLSDPYTEGDSGDILPAD